MSLFFEDVPLGEWVPLGSWTFTAEAIKDFARKYDPQPFHLDEEAARRSHFGALCASGWHTASVWMRLYVQHELALTQEIAARGERPGRMGPSPGFRNLRWLKPVYAGDTVTYAMQATGREDWPKRPKWGLLLSENEGRNQKGELVFSFDGRVLIERRVAEAAR